MKKTIETTLWWEVFVLWAAVIVVLSSIPSLTVEALGIWDFILRKWAHLIEFALFAYFLGRALRQHHEDHWPMSVLFTLIFGFVWAALDEVHQSFVPGRHGVLADVAVDGFGVILGTIISWHHWLFQYHGAPLPSPTKKKKSKNRPR